MGDGLQQARWVGENKPSNGLTNVSVEDITLDVSEKAKQNILVASNEVAVLGYNEGVEFATMLDAKTGEVVDGCRLIKGEQDTVKVTETLEIRENAKDNSLMFVHNHTNGTTFSIGDIEFLFDNPSVSTLLVIAGEEIHVLQKTTETVFDLVGFKAAFWSAARSQKINKDEPIERFINASIFGMKQAAKLFNLNFEEWGT